MTGQTISIAMCTYNGARYLQDQLDSIAKQNITPDELIVCDDRSTDNTLEILQRFANDLPYPVVITVNDNNLGSIKNFERAISLCNSDIIILSDQDDVWYPEKLAVIKHTFSISPDVGLVFSNADVVNEFLQPLQYRIWENIYFTNIEQNKIRTSKAYEILLQRNVVTGATMAFRSKFKKIITPFPQSFVHDHWIALLFSCCSSLYPIDTPLMQYRKHQKQQIGTSRGNVFKTVEKNVNYVQNKLEYINEDIIRLSLLLNRLKENQIDNLEVCNNLNNIISHLKLRKNLPRNKYDRLAIIMRALPNYHRFSLGWKSVLTDIFF
jgi:glycosyltransferase involved in cell wall biosynthesis